jgi:hypothetical protein
MGGPTRAPQACMILSNLYRMPREGCQSSPPNANAIPNLVLTTLSRSINGRLGRENGRHSPQLRAILCQESDHGRLKAENYAP